MDHTTFAANISHAEAVELINEHRVAVGREPFANLDSGQVGLHLALIDENAQYGNDPWGDSYFSLNIPFEEDPKLRSPWHPTERTGPFSVLSRGAFRTAAEAKVWADEKLGLQATYTVVEYT